jgi:uncharacterized protein (TIGR03437 family)
MILKSGWITFMRGSVVCLSAVLVLPLFGQGAGSLVTNVGYQPPQPLKVAPGQVLTVFVRTSSINLTGRVAANVIPLPVTLVGLSVMLRQTFSNAIPVPIFSTAPANNCSGTPAEVPCIPLTAITVQVPFELFPNVKGSRLPENFASLTVAENGVEGDPLRIAPVAQRLHIVNTCDATEAPTDETCRPVVRHPNGALVSSDNPAQANEILTVSAYGLGRTDTRIATGQASPDPAVPVSEMRLGIAFGANLAPARPNSNTTPLSAVLVPGRIGLYNITFQAPAIPADTPACTNTGRSNMTVTIARGASFDGVPLCAQ